MCRETWRDDDFGSCPVRSVATQTLLRSIFPLQYAAVVNARLAVFEALREHETLDKTRDAVALAASELCSNAVQAGKGEVFEVELSISSESTAVELRVLNEATLDDIPERSTWPPADRLAVRGRGLSIVESIASSIEFSTSGGRLAAIATFT